MDSDIIVIKFADSQVPVFKESRKDWIMYGEDNLYPEYLTYLYNKSAKHAAIINGKVKYIFGSGFRDGDEELRSVNSMGETWDDLAKKMAKDIEIYGGFRLWVVRDRLKRILEVRHIEYEQIRTGKDGGFWYAEKWSGYNNEATHYTEFSEFSEAFVSVYAYNEYRPGVGYYPLPEYLACNNYIETDIEISKYNLSCIRNGMMPSKMVQFFDGNPADEKKKAVEQAWKKKFNGSENGGSLIMAFSPAKDKAIEITDLSATESDKLFKELNLTCQQEIFTGHQVVSPMLFGIKTEGQLGGSNELRTAYEIFINTYAKPKQQDVEVVVNYLSYLMGDQKVYKIKQLDPIGLILPDSVIENALTPDELREKLNLPKIEKPADSESQKTINALASVSPLVATKILDNLTINEIRGLAGLPPTLNGDTITAPASAPQTSVVNEDGMEIDTTVNDNLKNLTAKQHQQIKRIVREYKKAILDEASALLMLRSGFGLSEEDARTLLGINAQFSTQDEIIQLFDACGEDKRDFHLIKAKKVKFSSDEEAMEDEMGFYAQAFAVDISVSEADILDLIQKDKRITPDVIAETLGASLEYITAKVAGLVKKGLLETKEVTIGEDVQIERKLTKPLSKIIDEKPTTTEILIKYSYEGPKDDKNRAFCKKMLELNRYYSRFEIENISQRLGYSVFDRKGGFWNKGGVISPSCRHNWQSNIIVRRGVKR